jgi:AcrR family transcriptional regulator
MTEKLWDRTRQAVYAEISRTAMGLFLDRGFEAVTIDEIAQASGISRRSFFRYFGTKEDIVLGDLMPQGELVLAALRARPEDEDPWVAATEALRAVEGLNYDEATTLKISKMLYGTPSLRARSIEKHLRWQELLVPELRRRLGAGDDPRDLRAGILIAGVMTCLDIAGEAWARCDGAVPLEELFRQASATLHPTGGSAA